MAEEIPALWNLIFKYEFVWMHTVTLKNKFQPDADQKQQEKAFCSACSNRIMYIYRINVYFFFM